jgi:hypothetical protein
MAGDFSKQRNEKMNLNEIEKSFATEDREVELLNPHGQKTGWFFQLRHESAKEVQSFMSDYRSKIQDVTIKRKTAAQKQLMSAHEDGLRIAHVAGWRWEQGEDEKKGRPPFSKRELKDVLIKIPFGWHVRTFIDNEVGSLDDFLAKSEDS